MNIFVARLNFKTTREDLKRHSQSLELFLQRRLSKTGKQAGRKALGSWKWPVMKKGIEP
jgi:hypothetical protein